MRLYWITRWLTPTYHPWEVSSKNTPPAKVLWCVMPCHFTLANTAGTLWSGCEKDTYKLTSTGCMQHQKETTWLRLAVIDVSRYQQTTGWVIEQKPLFGGVSVLSVSLQISRISGDTKELISFCSKCFRDRRKKQELLNSLDEMLTRKYWSQIYRKFLNSLFPCETQLKILPIFENFFYAQGCG